MSEDIEMALARGQQAEKSMTEIREAFERWQGCLSAQKDVASECKEMEEASMAVFKECIEAGIPVGPDEARQVVAAYANATAAWQEHVDTKASIVEMKKGAKEAVTDAAGLMKMAMADSRQTMLPLG